MISQSTLLACATCQSNSAFGGGEAAQWSILFLLAVVCGLLVGIGWFMWRMAVREREHLEPELSDDYVPDSSR